MADDTTPRSPAWLLAPLAAAGARAKAAVDRFYSQQKAARTNDMAISNTMTKESIRAIIDSVEYDQLAGMGVYTKKDLLVDRLLAHCRTSQNVSAPVAAPAPILNEVAQIEIKKEPIKAA